MDDIGLQNKNQIAKIDGLYTSIETHINAARAKVVKSINIEMVKAYWLIGRDIVEHEQQGNLRAEYGKDILQALSIKLSRSYGRGFSIENLTLMRKFYFIYQVDITKEKSYAVRTKLPSPQFSKQLSWTHYRRLMRINRAKERIFYEQEAAQNSWSARELERQIDSLLYERLEKSQDREHLMSLVCENQEIECPPFVLKDPTVLEFLNLPESSKLVL